MQLPPSELERHLHAIASREFGGPVPQSTADAMRESINDHHLREANDWLLPLLQGLLAGRPTSGPVEIPAGYPAGENGLANLLADLKAEPWLHVDDYGEGVIWRLPAAGLEVFICRETASRVRGAHTYQIRRLVG